MARRRAREEGRERGVGDDGRFAVSASRASRLSRRRFGVASKAARGGVDGVDEGFDLCAKSSGGVVSHARAVVHEHGALRGFFRGADVTVLKAFPTNAVGFLALSTAKRLLGVDEDEGMK